ncbi:hypothetical protein AB1K91_01950 [Terribacillus sp. 179-K 1B1 HS]|uniref:hypothetical protein n=1 Tax=Terribacillus sp. 179-K 1B1 HS TaxID=3142388 RepID=UPI0039A3F0BC
MDVKYRSSQWEKTKDSLRNLIGLGVWGKGMIDTMKDITDNLDEASEKVAKYDSDGVVSFSYTSDKDKYQRLFEDFKVLEDFSGSVGNIVEDTIDQPFYEDIDAFVQKVRDSSISNYTTSNHIGATETIPISYYGSYQEYETEKTEITIDDILSGDNYYADQIKASFEEWKVQNPDEDISYEDYRTAAVNTRAFEYESIEDGQFTKEFWVNIAALVVIVGVTVVCPPAGAVLGAAYATVEMGSAISGKDWASGRDLDTSERWTRGLLAPLDVLPIGNAVTSFGGTARTTSRVIDVGQSASKVNKTNTAVQQADNVIELKVPADRLARTPNVESETVQADNVISLADYANRQTANRLRNSQWVVKEQDKVQELQKAAGAENQPFSQNPIGGNVSPVMMRNGGSSSGGIEQVKGPAQATHVSNGDAGRIYSGSGRASNRQLQSVKGTGNTVNDYLDDIIVKGDVDTVKMNKLKNAIQNNTFSVDELSEIRKRMFELGISKEYDEALIKIDFGKYLRGLIGDPPSGMIDPHAHHILFKKGLGDAQQKLVQEGQDILRKYGIEPVIGKENLVWAPNRIAGQHSISALENVVNQLKAVDAAGADLDDMIEILEDLGKQAASRR